MPTLAPRTEDPTAMQNRQLLDATTALLGSLNLLRPGAAPAQGRGTSNVLLAPGRWASLAPKGTGVTALSGLNAPATTIDVLTLGPDSQVTEVRNLTVGNLIVQVGASPVVFVNTVHTGTISIEAGPDVAFLGVDFAGAATAINNAGLAADVLVSGAIKRNLTAHVNATVTGELVV